MNEGITPTAGGEGQGRENAGMRPRTVSGAKDAKKYRKGHRERLRARYRAGGEATLQDYELLELFLTFAIPRRDTKLLARKLLERFGSLPRVFEADPARLEEIKGVGPHAATLISLVRPLAARFLKDSRGTKVHPRSIADVSAYFRAKLKGLGDEEVHVAFVNARNAVIGTECLHRGTVDQSVVYVRKVIERALANKASGFILAHNHPSGDPTPSDHDRQLTQAVKAAAATVGLRFLDHLIIGDSTPFSFKANGSL